MMNSIKTVMVFLATMLFFFVSNVQTQAAWYENGIVYQQAITKLLKRGDITWSDKTDSNYKFGSVLVNAEGSKVLFAGTCEFCSPAEKRPFLVNPDGTGIQDLYGMLPADITNRWSAWRNLTINDDASKIFFRAFVETGYYDDQRLYVYDVGPETLSLGVNQQSIGSLDFAWLFRINEDGSLIYLDKINAGYDSELEKTRRGLFYAPTGGTKTWYLDVDDLSCESECGNLNMLKVLGVSVQNDLTFFRWNSDYWRGDGLYHTGFWYTGLDGSASLLTDEHYTIDDGDSRGISNADGNKVIYKYRHESGDIKQLAVVSVPSGVEEIVGWTSGLNGFDAHMTRSGKFILTRGEYGDHGTYYQTLIDLESGTSRDTWSYYLPSQWGSTSNITEDDRYYFYSLDGYPNDSEAVAGLYRIDMQTSGDSSAPYVQQIAFNAPVLLDHQDATIGVRAVITDPQGTGNIEWVKLTPLVEGQEQPSWAMGRKPLAFPTGDPGSALLYDDGTHGDETAGDGIFSFDSIATRKGDYEGFNTWYQHYSLPAPVGIRIIVKDTDNNYAIADTQLTISKLHADPDNLRIDLGESDSIQIFGAETPYTVVSSHPEIASAIIDGDLITVAGNKIGNTVLTIEDNTGNLTTVTVQVIGSASAIMPSINLLLMEDE